MRQILDAIMESEASGAAVDVAGIPVPESYRGVVVRADESAMFDGMDSRDKDPRKSLHVQEVATPEVGPGEALIAVMGSAINYNTVWTSIFEPLSTFSFLRKYGRLSALTKRHDLPYHVVGSDAAGVVLKVGAGVTKWKPGDEVVAHCPAASSSSTLRQCATTSSPGFHLVTPAPTFSTTPAASEPTTW